MSATAMRAAFPLRTMLLALVVLAAGAVAAAAQTSPFGRGTPGAPGTPQEPRSATAPVPVAPDFVSGWAAALRKWQSDLTASLAREVRAYKEQGALAPVLTMLAISFLYGVAHAVGPGHGKVATAAYFGATRARAIQGVTLSGMIGAVQAVSAIAFVGAFALVFQVSQTQTMRSVLYVEAASFGLIALVGVWIAWGGIVGRGCTHEHGLGAHGHAHDHDHGHGHGGGAAAMALKPAASFVSMLPVAIASGLRPCTGAILVLLFALSQGIFEIGVLSTFVMSLGTFVVVTLIGLGVIYARRAASRTHASERVANVAQRAVSLLGGILVFGFGAMFLYGSLLQMGFKI